MTTIMKRKITPLSQECMDLRRALKEIRKEAQKAKPNPDKIFLLADDALNDEPQGPEEE